MKPVDIKSSKYFDFNKENNKEDPKFEVNDHATIPKYRNNFAKVYTPDWSEDYFVIKKVKNTVPWTYVVSDYNGEDTVGICYEKELQKTNQTGFRVEKVIEGNGDKLYVKWKCYVNLFSSWINKKVIV